MTIPPTSFHKTSTSTGAWFSVTNWVDLSNIVAPVEISSLPATNLTIKSADSIYRRPGIITGDSTIQLDIDLGNQNSSTRKVGVLSFATTRGSNPTFGDQGSTLSGSDTVRHKLYSDTIGGTLVYDSTAIAHGMLPGYGVHSHLLATAVDARWWRLEISALSKIAATPGGYVDLIRAWAGEVFTFDVNADYGAEISWEANSNVTKAELSMSEFIDVGEPYRVFNLTFSGINNDELQKLMDFERITCGQYQFLFGLSQSNLGFNTIYCRNSDASGIVYSNPGRYRKRYKLIESY